MSARSTGRAARVAVVLLVTLLVGEAGLRLWYLGASRAILGFWRRPPAWRDIRELDDAGAPWPRPHGRARWALHPWAEPIAYDLDENGFRIDPSDERAGRAAHRVLVAGDSNAFGYGVAAADAYPARLVARLAERGVAADVANAGICGSNVRLQRAWLERVLPGSGVDVVVLTVSPWSLRIDHAPPPRDTSLGDRVWNVLAAQARTASTVSSLADRVHRRIAHSLHGIVDWPSDRVAWELEPLVEPRADFARRLEQAGEQIRRVSQTVRELGARLILVFVPLDLQVSRLRNELYRDERLPHPSFAFEERDYTSDDRYGEVRRIATSVSAPLIDVTAALRETGPAAFLADDYHLSPAGHARVASAVAPIVAQACGAAADRSPSDGERMAQRGARR